MRGQARRYSDSAQNLLHYWKGEAAQNFCHAHEQLAVDLQKLADAFERTAGELQSLASRNDHIQELKRQAQQVEWQLQCLDESDPRDRSEAHYLRQRLHDLYYVAEMEARAADERAASAFREIGAVANTLFVSAVQVHASTNAAPQERHWWEKALDFLSGVVYSMGDSSSFGLLGLAVDDQADLRSEEYLRGKIFGDYLSTGIGVVTAVQGLLLAAEGAVGGTAFSWTGVGLAVGAGVSVVGVAEAAYGTGMALKGYANLQKDKSILEARKSRAESTSAGESKHAGAENTYTPVEYEGTTKVDGEVRDISRRVYQRSDIDWDQVDPETGLTNLELMKKGRPPYWKDGSKVELHHTIQLEPGPMVELPASLHDEYSKILHGLVENGGSFRNNPTLEKQYNNFRAKYWRWRAKQLEE